MMMLIPELDTSHNCLARVRINRFHSSYMNMNMNWSNRILQLDIVMWWLNDAFYIRHHRQANCWFSNLECRRPYALIKLVTAFPREHLLLLDENRMIIPSRNWMFILLERNTHIQPSGGKNLFLFIWNHLSCGFLCMSVRQCSEVWAKTENSIWLLSKCIYNKHSANDNGDDGVEIDDERRRNGRETQVNTCI